MRHFIEKGFRTHCLPYFSGKESHRHINVPLFKLYLKSFSRPTFPNPFREVHTYLSFIGFARSGHSLVGSIVDAHPEAMISHELDTLGLIEEGFSQRRIFQLIKQNSEAFSQNGRYWNGYCYEIPAKSFPKKPSYKVIGDKKGDVTTLRLNQEPQLLDRFQKCIKTQQKWIFVQRHPFDNISTLALRRNPGFDKNRIQGNAAPITHHSHNDAEFSAILDQEISSYFKASDTIQATKAKIPAHLWHEIQLETLIAQPQQELTRLFDFLKLPIDAPFLKDCQTLLRPTPSQTRTLAPWSPKQIAQVQTEIKKRPEFQWATQRCLKGAASLCENAPTNHLERESGFY